MALNVWMGGTSAVAMVTTTQITAYDAATTYKLTLTDDNGNTEIISQVGTGGTVNTTATALAAAWNASTDPRVAKVTASAATDTVTLTADTAGRPYSVASSVTGGTGTIGSTTTTTASAGPNDYGVADNWSLGAAPVATNDVLIPVGAPAILYSLNQSTVAIGAFTRQVGHTTAIGRIEFGFYYHLRIDPDSLSDEGGSSLTMYDIGTAAIAPSIKNTGSPTTGYQGVYLKGSAMSAVNVQAGTVGIGTEEDDATTEVTTINVSGSTSIITVGDGVSDVDDSTIDAVNLYSSATCYNKAAVATVTCNDSTYHQQVGNWTTLNAYGQKSRVYPNATGTYATTRISGGAKLLNTLDQRAKTFTTTIIESGSELTDPLNLITHTNPIQVPAGLRNTIIDKGLQIDIAITAI